MHYIHWLILFVCKTRVYLNNSLIANFFGIYSCCYQQKNIHDNFLRNWMTKQENHALENVCCSNSLLFSIMHLSFHERHLCFYWGSCNGKEQFWCWSQSLQQHISTTPKKYLTFCIMRILHWISFLILIVLVQRSEATLEEATAAKLEDLPTNRAEMDETSSGNGTYMVEDRTNTISLK